MRFALIAALVFCAGAAVADEIVATPAGTGALVYVSASYTVTVPFAETEGEAVADQERRYRTEMYKRAATDCEDLLATIAKTCQLTNISISSQLNNYPGQPPTMTVSASTTLQIEMKP